MAFLFLEIMNFVTKLVAKSIKATYFLFMKIILGFIFCCVTIRNYVSIIGFYKEKTIVDLDRSSGTLFRVNVGMKGIGRLLNIGFGP